MVPDLGQMSDEMSAETSAELSPTTSPKPRGHNVEPDLGQFSAEVRGR